MKRAVAFCQTIAVSKQTTEIFNSYKEIYYEKLTQSERAEMVDISADHIDGTMNATLRSEKLSWLKSENRGERECRILTNVRCLSEGVDVPALDAVLFLSARNSEIDVVQSVGRVMRTATQSGKKYGYIIIPVIVPPDKDPEAILEDDSHFKVVWTILRALRAHDDRFDATVEEIKFGKKRPENISIIGGHSGDSYGGDGRVSSPYGSSYNENEKIKNAILEKFESFKDIIYARMVLKVGNKEYMEQWASAVAEVAKRNTARIKALAKEDGKHKRVFEQFLAGLQRSLNPSITSDDAIDMLAQHIITRPIFEALFGNYSFVKNNPVSASMQEMLDLFDEKTTYEDKETMRRFFDSISRSVGGIESADARQHVIKELYEKFFKIAFPNVVEKLGIVYTPVEVVDFIINSVSDILQKEFHRDISDKDVHIIDPFVGTGTFITRLLQSGRILPEAMEYKYQNEIHANEIVLLAYYIASINIESVYHDIAGEQTEYVPFNGICLTDTFQLGETISRKQKDVGDMFRQNSERVTAQQNAPLRIIIGNPPYSVGQKSANDNSQNQSYPHLEKRIAETYAAKATATNKNSLYDSYIKAFRWASDRLAPETGGIIAFVSNGSWLDGNATAGFRKCLESEFSSIYVFNLRGNARTSGEQRQKEKGNVFGSGSRTPIAITLLVKNRAKAGKAEIHYRDIGDYLSRKEKLDIVKKFDSFTAPDFEMQKLTPNHHGDWISQRNEVFNTFIPIGDKNNKGTQTFFVPHYSNGLKTQRDAWCYNSSKDVLCKNIRSTIDFYNTQRKALHDAKTKDSNITAENFVDRYSTKISWTRALLNDVSNNKEFTFSKKSVRVALYRPFYKQYLYFSRSLNEMVYQIPKQFPTPGQENLVICVSGTCADEGCLALISDS
ncbi:MAG: type ISP restriction/modification enzyme, partial [Synergistaceae bacterium]|nr:type ISP restriction/modification enzyme [Synergistaceae bacterium]